MPYEQKTRINDASVKAFLDKIEDPEKKADCFQVLDMMTELTGFEPKMWGTSIVGFGSYHYKYASGHEGDSCILGFSPRKANITFYLAPYMILEKSVTEGLGKFKHGKGCLYINKLEDVNIEVLKKLILKSLEVMKEIIATRMI
jgi:hypothetical protein